MVSPGYIPFHPNPSKPEFTLPKGSVDSHCHVFGPGDVFPYAATSSYVPVDAPKELLFQRHKHLGIDRAVIVQASCHGTDNRAMIDALKSAGDTYRGIAIVNSEITEAELKAMDEVGVRGVRFNFVKRLKARQPIETRINILEKIKQLPWHLVVYFEPADLAEIKDFLMQVPVPVVIDHMGCIPSDKGAQSKEFEELAELLRDDRFWIKVSCPERFSKEGAPYLDMDEVASELIRMIPDRVLWGTDWPHPNMKKEAPDDGILVDRIARICPDEQQQKALLIENRTRLYWG